MYITRYCDPRCSSPLEELAWEVLYVALILAGVLAAALSSYAVLLDKARFSEVLTLLQPVRSHLAAEHAATGRWPEVVERSVTEPLETAFDGHLEISQGSFGVSGRTEHLGDFSMAFTRAEGGHATHIWTCGYARPAVGRPIAAPVATTLPPRILPSVCRDPESSR